MPKELKHYQTLLIGSSRTENKSDDFYANDLTEAVQRILTQLKESDKQYFDLHVEEIV